MDGSNSPTLLSGAAAGNSAMELKSLGEWRQATDEKLVQQQKSIDFLMEKVQAQEKEIQMAKGNGVVSVDVAGEDPEVVEDFNAEVANYEFDMSMWDATLLLYVGRECTSVMDKVVIIVGMGLNLSLQVALLVVIAMNMLSNSFDADRVQSMLDWRVAEGQTDAGFYNALGKTKVERLCNLELWSFEQSEYEEIYDYLYKDVPGYILSLLAIFLWTFTCMSEYRSTVEQLLAVLNLPTSKADETGRHRSVQEREDGLHVIGIGSWARIFAVFTLALPRLGVLGVLSVVGCQYLAQTISLADIVLNAVALAFVLDVDEALCHVVLSQRLRSVLEKMQPIPCGTKAGRTCGGIAIKDIVRYMVTVGLILMTVFLWLIPFRNNVTASADALCGGLYDFTYTGGNQADPTITLKNSSDWVVECTPEIEMDYLNQYYGTGFGRTRNASGVAATVDWEAKVKTTVLSHAFKGCLAGEIKDPKSHECKPIPDTLMTALNAMAVTVGGYVDPPVCQRLNTSLGMETCNTSAYRSQESCLWSWRSQTCETSDSNVDGLSPGKHHANACNGPLQTQCEEWADWGYDHPTLNCDAVSDMCPRDQPDCMGARGTISFQLSNGTAFRSNQTVTNAAILDGIKTGLGLTDASTLEVTVDYSRRLQMIGGTEADTPISTSLNASASYTIQSFPTTMKTQAFLATNASIVAAINELFNASLGIANLVLSAAFDEPEFLTNHQLEQEAMEAQRAAQEAAMEAERAAQEAERQAQEEAMLGDACNPVSDLFDVCNPYCHQYNPCNPECNDPSCGSNGDDSRNQSGSDGGNSYQATPAPTESGGGGGSPTPASPNQATATPTPAPPDQAGEGETADPSPSPAPGVCDPYSADYDECEEQCANYDPCTPTCNDPNCMR